MTVTSNCPGGRPVPAEQASPGEGHFAAYDIIELLDQPRQALGPARKSPDGRPPAVQVIALQQRSGCGPFAELVERQRLQEISRRCRSTFGKSLQEDQRALRPVIEQRRHGGQHENDRIAGARLDRLLRKRQETRVEGRISEGRKQPFRPDVAFVGRVCEQIGLT